MSQEGDEADLCRGHGRGQHGQGPGRSKDLGGGANWDHPQSPSLNSFQMHHPNIVGFCETFVEENFVCIVIEYCEVLQVCHARRDLQGGDLSTHIAKQRADGSHFSTEEVLDWFVELAMALQYIHDRCVACGCSGLMRWQAGAAPRHQNYKHFCQARDG